MYYIYLDEAYNLTPGARNQLIVFGGFGTTEPKKIVKAYKKIRRFNLKHRQIGAEIKSNDAIAIKKLIPKMFKILVGLDIVIYIIRQDKKIIPVKYWQKNKLNYEQLYLDLLINSLVNTWSLTERNQVSVILDSFQTKLIPKDEMIKKVRFAFNQKYPNKFFKMRFMNSATDFNLQIADFIVGAYLRSFRDGPDLSDFRFGEGLRLNIVVNIL